MYGLSWHEANLNPKPVATLINTLEESHMNTIRMPIVCMLNASLAVGPIAFLGMGSTAMADGPTPIIVMQHGGIDASMPDPNDAGMRRAMHMMADRLNEFPHDVEHIATLMGEADSPDAQQAQEIMRIMMPLISTMSVSPMEFAVINNGENDFGQVDLDMRLVFETGSAKRANMMMDSLHAILAMSPEEIPLEKSTVQEGMLEFRLPMMGQVMVGIANEDGRFAIGYDLTTDGLNTEPAARNLPIVTGLPLHVEADHRPASRVYVDGKAILSLAEVFAPFGGPDAVNAIQMVTDNMPDGPIGMDYSVHFAEGRQVAVTRFNGMGLLDDTGTMAGSPIELDALRAVPADARMVSITGSDIGAGFEAMMQDPMMGAMMDEAFNEIENVIGFHVHDDFIAHFGDTWINYMSDSTGGGGMMSTVMVNSGANAEGLRGTLDRLVGMANDLAGMVKYVRIHTWSDDAVDGDTIYSLTFPGVPIPLEVSIGFANDAVVMAMSPQALVGAIRQIDDGSTSVLNNPRFRSVIRTAHTEGAVAMKFVDTPRTIARGYPMVQMVGSLMSNFVRSPFDTSRQPGLVTPAYADLARDAHPILSVTYVEGNDVIKITQKDGSQLVNAAGQAGAAGLAPFLVAAGVAAAAAAGTASQSMEAHVADF